jgi:chemotaxis methyl-accepting protein methylase
MESDADGDFDRIRSLVRRRRGLDLGHYRRAYVHRRILARVRACRDGGPSEYARRLASDPDEVGRLLASLSTKVTSFFRNPGLYAYLERHVLPDLLAAPPGRTIRLWSAACATGEETYSLAAIAARHEPPPPEGRFRILGTDVDREAVAAARRGVYPVAALRTVPPEIQRRWFALQGAPGSVRVAAGLAAYVRFRVESLDAEPPAGAFDLILCRNVLIYFDPALQQRVLAQLARGLRPGGYLALGRVERVHGPARAAFEVVNLRERVYRRLREE